MSNPMYGIYNHAEKRWEYDRHGDLRAYSNRIFANAQADACWHQHNGRTRVYKDGKEIIPVMEVIEIVTDGDILTRPLEVEAPELVDVPKPAGPINEASNPRGKIADFFYRCFA